MREKRDSEIEQCILRELQLETEVSTKELCVFCSGGNATLSGTVKNAREKEAVLKAARRVVGVLRAIDHIKVREVAQRAVSRPLSPAIAAIDLTLSR